VVPGDALAAHGFVVLVSAVTHVGVPAITGMAPGQPGHQLVANLLGHHTRRGNRGAPCIAVHQCLVRIANLGKREPVHQHLPRPQARDGPANGTAHGEGRGHADVEPVDLAHRRGGHANADRTLADLRQEMGTLAGTQQLGVAEPDDASHVGRKHHRGGHDRPGQRPAPGFIDADQHAAGEPSLLFLLE